MKSANDHKPRLLARATVRGIFLLGITTVSLVGRHPANAAIISFSEDQNGTAPIAVNTDIAGATITTSVESASLGVGNITGPSTLLLKRAMTNQGTMTMEGGGGGVSDVLELDSSVSNGATVGFLATFLSDAETSPERGIPTPQGLTQPNILEDGTLQLLTPAAFSVTLPGVGVVNLEVSAQSDAVEIPEGVPEPSTLALLSAGLFGLGILRRRRHSDKVIRVASI
jgi:PEP-CTERM motif